jgi:hypothetical protein
VIWLIRIALAGAGLILVAVVGVVWWLLPGRHEVERDVELPVRYAGGRYFVEPVTRSGVKLSLLTDTGGGLMLSRGCAMRTGIKPATLFGREFARLPQFRPDAWIPEATGGERWMPLRDVNGDGMLGQRWFAGGVWTFDYPARKVILRRVPFEPTPTMASHRVPLGFRHEWRMRTSNHPRIVVTIAGEPVDCLFDTGATAWLSPEALRLAGDGGPSERATSFISADLFTRWREAHPEWRVIDAGCEKTKEPIIEIPEVEVGGLRAGPVWFTRRMVGNYTWMSTFMDQPIVGAVGGNFLEHFRVTVDYPGAVAYFEGRSNEQ